MFWAAGHPFNMSEPSDGMEQTNNRAELMAVIRALQLELRDLEVRSDSAYVINGVTRSLTKWRKTGFYNKTCPIENRDLWQHLDHLLQCRPHGSVRFLKVHGGASADDVLRGRVTLMDKLGNDNADALAVAGANKAGNITIRAESAVHPPHHGCPAHDARHCSREK